MKNFSQITENLDVANKKYVDDGLSKKVNTSDIVQVTGADITKIMSQKAVTDELDKKANRSGDTFTGDVIISSGKSLKTDIIKSADGTKWIAEITAAGLEIGGQGTPLRLYSSTRPIHANANKELAYTSDIPTNYVTTDTTQTIAGKKTFTNTIVKKSNTIDLKKPNGAQWNYIEFTDKNDDRIGIAGSRFDAGGYAGVYLQARNSQQLWIASSTPDSNGNTVTKTSTPTPPDTDDSTQIANTSWVRTNYQEKGYAGIDGAVVNSDGKVTDKDGNVVDALYFKVASLTTEKAYMRTYLLAEVAMTNIVKEQATVLIRCTTESSTSAPNVTITLDNYSYASLLLPKNIFVTADYKSGTAGATFTVWVKQDKDFMQQVWNVLSQNTRNYTTTSKREWSVFYSNITKATAVTDINAAPTGYTRIVANNNNRYSNLEENTYLWQQSQNAGITWKRYSDNTTRGVFRHYDDGTTENFVTQSDGFLFRPLDNKNTKSIKVDPKTGALYPEQNAGATLGKESQRWNDAYIQNSINLFTGSSGTPNVNVVNTGLTSGTNPTATKYSNLNFGEVNGKNLSVVRSQVNSAGRVSTDLWTRSFGTNHGNYVGFFASPNASSASAAGVWHFSPNLDAKHDLGQSTLRWRNLYCVQGNISADNNPSCNLIDTGLINGTNPTNTRGVQVIGRDKNNLALTGWRGWVSKEGYTSSHLYARSFGTDYSNYVALYGKPNAPTYDETSAETKNSTGSNSPNIWYFAPATKNNVDLGASGQRWNNGYITNLQLCKVINGGGGNSMIQQNSDTNGADITVGSTGCPLKIQGKNARPTYRQGKDGTYANLALQSDIKAQVAYGTCETAANVSDKIVTVSDTTWALTPGTIIGVKFTNTNTASNVTINVNNSGKKSIWYNNTQQKGNSNLYAGYANRLIYYMYDGTYWCWLNAGAENDTIPSAISWTGGGTKGKTATCHNYSLLAKSYTQVIMISSNTAKSALTLNINGKGAKPIYINGAASSETNYTLPAGSYFVYYDGTNYYFRTDGNLTVRGSVAMTKSDFSLSGTTLTITL